MGRGGRWGQKKRIIGGAWNSLVESRESAMITHVEVHLKKEMLAFCTCLGLCVVGAQC